MRTLIIPCAGRSTIDNVPKYLAMHPEGKYLFEKCIEGINSKKYTRIIYTILKQDAEVYMSEELIKSKLSGYPVEVCVLDNFTSGPAETVYFTLMQMHVQGSFVVKDSDNYVQVNDYVYENFVAGLDLMKYEKDIYNIRNKSFIILNEQKQILDILEKQLRSDTICLGMYGFHSVEDYIFAYNRLNDKNYKIKKLYISHVISYLIGYSGKVFYYIPAVEYENWGNARDWNRVKRLYATYFINADGIEFDNIDTQNALKILSENGAKMIFYTEENDSNLERKICMSDINCIGYVKNCNRSEIKSIINTKSELLERVCDIS